MHGQASRGGRIVVKTPAHQTAADNASGGSAILVHKGVGLHDNSDACVPEEYQYRITFGHVNGIMKGGVHLGYCYGCPSD